MPPPKANTVGNVGRGEWTRCMALVEPECPKPALGETARCEDHQSRPKMATPEPFVPVTHRPTAIVSPAKLTAIPCSTGCGRPVRRGQERCDTCAEKLSKLRREPAPRRETPELASVMTPVVVRERTRGEERLAQLGLVVAPVVEAQPQTPVSSRVVAPPEPEPAPEAAARLPTCVGAMGSLCEAERLPGSLFCADCKAAELAAEDPPPIPTAPARAPLPTTTEEPMAAKKCCKRCETEVPPNNHSGFCTECRRALGSPPTEQLDAKWKAELAGESRERKKPGPKPKVEPIGGPKSRGEVTRTKPTRDTPPHDAGLRRGYPRPLGRPARRGHRARRGDPLAAARRGGAPLRGAREAS